ncbi:MAG TPA: BadF/BadG/BcrA/BcrD ATPase family protein [Vicinamibacteria bacterium]|nr:BadF/BadG/BcrA/BcrD ATPase family protein [Vicinamibacteria bacterium]
MTAASRPVHVLGIDAGGTKTVCYLADGEARVLGEARGGGANLQTEGELGVEKVLHAVMADATAAYAAGIDAICLGMAGFDRQGEGVVLRGIMRRIGANARVVLVNDALVALVAGVGEAPGVVIICGTGSIAYGRNPRNQAARAGGWGYILGDEGSGYWIGRRALRAVARAADGRGPGTALTALVLSHFGIGEASDLVAEIYERQLRHHALAQVARLVQRARDEGDSVATRILEAAAHELLASARSVVERLRMAGEEFDFVLAGGVFTGVPWLAEELTRRLPGIAERARVKRLQGEPALGAVRIAIAEARGGARLPQYV